MSHAHTSDELDLWLKDLDTSVNDVFVRMLGTSCSPVSVAAGRQEHLKVTIGVTGRIQTTCSLYFSLPAAQTAVNALTGETMPDWESVADDAVGEIGNMIIGSLKRKADGGHRASVMSVPSVSRETAPQEPTAARANTCRREYSFFGNVMQIEFTPPSIAHA